MSVKGIGKKNTSQVSKKKTWRTHVTENHALVIQEKDIFVEIPYYNSGFIESHYAFLTWTGTSCYEATVLLILCSVAWKTPAKILSVDINQYIENFISFFVIGIEWNITESNTAFPQWIYTIIQTTQF